MNASLMTNDNDREYEEAEIERVERSGNSYVLRRSDGWYLTIPDVGIEPRPGQTARFYGRGIGSTVRGVSIDGRAVYYRTAAEDEKHWRDQTYPPTAAEALARWDKGDSVFTVELGGFGPGYEQAIHITIFEVIRDAAGLDLASGSHEDAIERFRPSAEATLNRVGGPLGLSGAQAGAAKSFAFTVLRTGWQDTVLKAPDDRRIQVSNYWPHL